MTAIFAILSIQALIGAFDNLWHHELEAKLPQRVSARHELTLHASREAIYGVLFLALAWTRWEGLWAWAMALLLAAEIVITLADFIEEDVSRRLPPLERVLHTILALSYGAFVAALAPVLAQWSQRGSALVPVSHGAWSWLFTLYASGVLAWSLRNAIAARRLCRQARRAAEPMPIRPAHGPAILVTGGTGFIGRALVGELVGAGRRVIVLTRDAGRATGTLGAGVQIVDSLDAIPNETPIAAVVNLAGAPILGGLWTAKRRRVLIDSRVRVTADVVALMRRLEHRPRVLVSASAIGFYGVRQDAAELDETAPPQPGNFQSELCAAWEHEARRAQALCVRVVRLRFGIVLGGDGGSYPPLARAARLGLACVLGAGRQPFAWVHRDDAVGLIRFALDHEAMTGAVNAVAPDLVSQASFAAVLAASFGRGLRLRVRAGWVRRLLGELSQLLLDGQNATPRAALAIAYRFRHPVLREALAALATGNRGAGKLIPEPRQTSPSGQPAPHRTPTLRPLA